MLFWKKEKGILIGFDRLKNKQYEALIIQKDFKKYHFEIFVNLYYRDEKSKYLDELREKR